MKSTMGIRKHALDQARMLLRRLAYQVNRAARSADPDCVHDLRVAIRRFTQCLRIFAQYFPAAKEKRVRKRLKKIMDLAAAVRNCDVALGLFEEAGVTRAAAVETLKRQRDAAEGRLVETLERWRRRDFSRKWRTQLEL